MKLRKSNVFITGGLGFIGYNLVNKLLSLGFNVTVFDNFSSSVVDKIENVKIIKGDILSFSELRRVIEGNDVVFHLAASSSVPSSFKQIYEDLKVNAEGTLNVLKASLESDVKLVIYTSSGGTVYGSQEKLPVNEGHQCLPISPYGISKLAGEYYCSVFNRTFGLNTIVLRLFNVYGPWQNRGVLFDWYKKIKQTPDRLELLGDGTQIKDFIYIDDLVDLLIKSVTNPKALGQVFNVGSGKGISIKELLKVFSEITQFKGKIYYTGKSWSGDVQRIYADTIKIKNLLNWETKTNLIEGVKKTIEWFDKTRVE